ncbi:MAG: MFS transporter [Solirubrobacterales bacterium]
MSDRSGPKGAAGSQLALIVVIEILAMSVWFSTAAVVPSLSSDWDISSGAAGWLTTAVQLGFVAGAVASALLNLADRIPIGKLIVFSALLAAASTALVAIVSEGLISAIPLRFITGVALAGVYPTGAKLVASWFEGSRGLAMGILLAALTLGSGLPHLVGSLGEPQWQTVLLVTSALCLLAAGLALRLKNGPFVADTSPVHPRYVLSMFTDPKQRAINLSYFGHMWELYALWTWMPLFVAASLVAGGDQSASGTTVGLVTFFSIGVAGFAGCVASGLLARRAGPMKLARLALAVSGTCCALSPFVFGTSLWLLTPVLLIWGFAVIADSPMFSTALSWAADPDYVGTALTAQMAIGFLVTAVAIRVTPLMASSTSWRWAFLILLPGPILGVLSIGGKRFRSKGKPPLPGSS